MKKINVLMYGYEYPPMISGGLGVACEGLTKELAKHQLNLTFVLPRKGELNVQHMDVKFADWIKKRKKTGEIQYKEVSSNIVSPYDSAIISNMTRTEITRAVKYFSNSELSNKIIDEVEKYEVNAARIAKKVEHDVIHAHDWLSFGAGVAAKKISKKPLISHIHSTEFDRCASDSINEYVYMKEKIGFDESDLIIAVSNLTKNTVVNKYGIDPAKIRVVYNGTSQPEVNVEIPNQLDFIDIAKQKGYKVVLFLGRLTIQKNPEIMLRVAKKLMAYNQKVLFVFCGNGDMENYLIQSAANMGLSDKVLFTGFIKGDQKAKIYNNADVFVMPSYSEPFGIVALEAQAHGVPIIISRQSGVAEIVLNGLKVDFWDENELLNKIYSVLQYPSLQKTLVHQGKREVKTLDWKQPAKKCYEIYREIIKNL